MHAAALQSAQSFASALPRVAPIAERRRLLSHALASVIASRGSEHLSDDDVFEFLKLDELVVTLLDSRLSPGQRTDVKRYLVSIGSVSGMPTDEADEAHDEACIALKPSLICMRWPGKTS